MIITLTIFFLFFSDDREGINLLKKLSSINRPLEITFQDMVKLMSQCQLIDSQYAKQNLSRSNDVAEPNTNTKTFFQNNPFSLFSGIIPGDYYFYLKY